MTKEKKHNLEIHLKGKKNPIIIHETPDADEAINKLGEAMNKGCERWRVNYNNGYLLVPIENVSHVLAVAIKD